jgi:hypothetical protein
MEKAGSGNPIPAHGSWATAAFCLNDRDLAVIVTVATIRMMQMAIHQVVNVISVRDCLMAAAFAVLVGRVVAAANVSVGTGVRVGGRRSQGMLIHMAFMIKVEVSIVEIVDMIGVLDCGVATIVTVLMGMVLVNCMRAAHLLYSFRGCGPIVQAITWAAAFRGMREGVENEFEDVLIRERIHDVLPFPFAANDIVRAQYAKAL